MCNGLQLTLLVVSLSLLGVLTTGKNYYPEENPDSKGKNFDNEYANCLTRSLLSSGQRSKILGQNESYSTIS